jgi:hypothetical protein
MAMYSDDDGPDITRRGVDAAMDVIRRRFPVTLGLDDPDAWIFIRGAIGAAAPHMGCEHDGQAWGELIAERDQLRARVRTLQSAIADAYTITDKLDPELRKRFDDIAADCGQPDLIDWVQDAIADAVLIARYASGRDPDAEEKP